MINYIPYQEGQPYSDRYAWWATQEIGNQNSNIDSYAKLLTQEYQKLINGEINIEQFEENTPEIDEETPLNYIRNRIIEWYPN
jgi:hypothetical protein